MTFGASGPPALWYLARGTGIVSLLLLTVSVVLGIVTSVRWNTPRWPRFSIGFLHRNASLLAVVLLIVHIATVVIDGFAPIGWKDAVIPFASGYRPMWLGLGTLSFDLILALTITSLLRTRVGQRTWRVVHWFAYACWPVAVVHGLGTGSDASTPVVLFVNAACVGVVVASVWWRIAVGWPRQAAVRGAALGASVLAPLALVVWLVAGPLASGWARRSGTPESLFAQPVSAGAVAPSTPSSAPTTAPALSATFAASFSGTVRRTATDDGRDNVEMTATLLRGASGSLIVELHGRVDQRGAFEVRDGTVTLSSATGSTLFDGRVTDIEDGTLLASSVAQSAAGIDLVIRFDSFNLDAGSASGSVRAEGAR